MRPEDGFWHTTCSFLVGMWPLKNFKKKKNAKNLGPYVGVSGLSHVFRWIYYAHFLKKCYFGWKLDLLAATSNSIGPVFCLRVCLWVSEWVSKWVCYAKCPPKKWDLEKKLILFFNFFFSNVPTEHGRSFFMYIHACFIYKSFLWAVQIYMGLVVPK